jgi:hypothetical protein
MFCSASTVVRVEVEDYRSLPADSDERVVVSVIADRGPGEDGWRLRHATCLVAPAACAQTSWRGWAAAQSGEQEAFASGGDLPATCRIEGDDWLLARETPDLKRARAWLTEVNAAAGSHANFVSSELGRIPALRAELTPPTAVVRAMQFGGAGCGNLVAGAVRPAVGVMWRGARQPLEVDLPPRVNVGASFAGWPSRDVAGIHLTPTGVAEQLQTPEGLFVGRLERRAWLIDQQGTREGDHKLARLRWDAAAVDPSGLVLQVEEFDDYGELVLSQRIALADHDLVDVSNDAPYEVRLPTLGHKLRHGLSLYAADGSLLDRHEPWPFAETVSLSISLDGSIPLELTSGVPLAVPALDERLGRATEVSRELTRARLSGAENRVLDHARRRPRMRALLETARGELLVADPFFGQVEADWTLVAGLAVQVRILTSKVAQVPAPIPAGVQARIALEGKPCPP